MPKKIEKSYIIMKNTKKKGDQKENAILKNN